MYIVTVNAVVTLQLTNESLNEIYDKINAIGDHLTAIQFYAILPVTKVKRRSFKVVSL